MFMLRSSLACLGRQILFRPQYADHLPLYRETQIYSRQGMNLDHVGRLGRPRRLASASVQERLLDRLKSSPKLFTDETTAPVLDPGPTSITPNCRRGSSATTA